MGRADSWRKQAQSDFNWARITLAAGFFSQTCFIAQQVAEKCLKAIAYKRGAKAIKGHGVTSLLKDLQLNGRYQDYAQSLDLFYISARYPDALPESVAPSEHFGKHQAEQALEQASAFVELMEKEFANG